MPLAKRRPRTEITPGHVDAIVRLSTLGLLQSEIAARIGISPSSVARVQARAFVPHVGRGAKSGDPVPGARA